MIVNVEDWWLKTLEDNVKFYKQQVYKVNTEFDNYKRASREYKQDVDAELREFRKKEDAYKRFQAKRRKMIEYQHSLEAKVTRQRNRIKELEDDLQALTGMAAIEAWNNRAERTCKNVSEYLFGCSSCGECHYEGDIPDYCPNCGAKVVE